MDPVAVLAIVVILATIFLPLLGVGLTLWMGGPAPREEEGGGGADPARRA